MNKWIEAWFVGCMAVGEGLGMIAGLCVAVFVPPTLVLTIIMNIIN